MFVKFKKILPHSLKRFFEIVITTRNWAAIFAIFMIAVVVRLTILVSTNFVFDDAYIYARIANNFSNGFGPVYNIGDNIQTNTSFLFLIVLSAFWKLIGETSIDVVRFFGAFADAIVAVGIVWLLSGGLRENNKIEKQIPFLALMAGIAYAIIPTAAIPAVGGLETPFFSLVIIAVFLAILYGRFNLAIMLAIISVFIRPEGAIAAVIAIAFVWYKQRKISIQQLFMIIGGALLYCFIILINYGTLIPQTVIAKSLVKGSVIDQWILFLKKFYISWMVLLPGFLSIIGIYRVFRHLKSLIPIFIYGLIYVLIITSFGSWWPWYFPPFIIIYILSIFIGIEQLRNAVSLHKNFKKISMVLVYIMSGIILVGFTVKAYSSIKALDKKAITAWKNETAMVSMWIRSNIPHDKTGMLEPAGLYGLFLPYRIDDYPGLASRSVTTALKRYKSIGGEPKSLEGFFYAIDMVKPDFLVLRESEFDAFIKTDTSRQYENRYSCCAEFNTQERPFFVLVRKKK